MLASNCRRSCVPTAPAIAPQAKITALRDMTNGAASVGSLAAVCVVGCKSASPSSSAPATKPVKAESQKSSHVAHVRRDHDTRQAGFDERADVTPQLWNIAAPLYLSGDENQNRCFKQHENDVAGRHEQDGEASVPNSIQHRGHQKIDGPEANGQRCGYRDERDNAQPLGFEHLESKRVLELRRKTSPMLSTREITDESLHGLAAPRAPCCREVR